MLWLRLSPRTKYSPGASVRGAGGIAGILHERKAIGGRLGNPIDIEDSLCDLYRISRQGHDPFDDIASQRLVADDNDIVIVQTVWQTEFLKEDRLPRRCRSASMEEPFTNTAVPRNGTPDNRYSR